MVIAEAETSFGTVTIVKVDSESYEVRVDDISKHGRCDAESAIRALAHYLNGEGYKASKVAK